MNYHYEYKGWGAKVVAMVIFASVLYGSYWVVKTVSYEIFYKSMVEATVVDMVKQEALKK